MGRPNRLVIIFYGLILLIPTLTTAEIYKWVDEKGKVHFGERKPEGSEAKTVDLKPLNTGDSVKVDKHRYRPKKSRPSHYSGATPRKNSTPPPRYPLSERECQRIYGLNCSRVFNWIMFAVEQCKKDRGGRNCKNEYYLRDKYKPTTLEEQRLSRERARALRDMRAYRRY